MLVSLSCPFLPNKSLNPAPSRFSPSASQGSATRAASSRRVNVSVVLGSTVVGARKFLIAFNVRLKTADVGVAQAIARRIRESSGGFRHVKALGLYLESHQCAQVSMNLTDFTDTDLDAVDRAIPEPAASELIGFVPQAAYDRFPAFFERAEGWERSRIIEVALEGGL